MEFRSKYDGYTALVIKDEIDSDGDLYFEIDSDGSAYIHVEQVQEILQHLTKLLEENK